MDWILPPGASTFATEIDRIYYIILVITGIAFVVVEAGLLWFIIKYRGKPGRRATYTHGSMRAEVIWTAVPAITVVALGIMSGGLWSHIKGRHSVPVDAIPYRVHVKQFEWNITHPGPDGVLDTPDDFTLRNQLHIPANHPVVMHLVAEDVIHSFFIPAFRIKQDAVPGMQIQAWFEATKPGSYELGCAELCGIGHYRMRAEVTVHDPTEFREWMANQAALRSAASGEVGQ
jgi:cytochrome c oxidase subunit II